MANIHDSLAKRDGGCFSSNSEDTIEIKGMAGNTKCSIRGVDKGEKREKMRSP